MRAPFPAVFPFANVLPWLAALCLLLAGCAARPDVGAAAMDCQGMKDLVFVSHMDDDLLFMNPDIDDAIQSGACLRVVYLTASERNEGAAYMDSRERAVRAAYAYMAGQPDDWIAGQAQAGDHRLAAFTLRGAPRIQLWHMRLRDPWLGKGWGSLTPLSRAESVDGASADTLETTPQSYTRNDLVQTIAGIIRDYGPTTVRHMDDTNPVAYTALCWRCAGHGHPDHIAGARLVREAMLAAPGRYAQVGYMDYPIQERTINLGQDEIDRKTAAFRRYAWVDYRYCRGPEQCREPAGPAAAWVQRQHYVSRRNLAAALIPPLPHGHLQVLATGEATSGIHLWDAGARQWRDLGGRSPEAAALASGPDGSASLLARDALGRIWANPRMPDGRWQGWQAIADARMPRLPALASQGMAAIGMGNDGMLYWTRFDTTLQRWRPWSALPALPDASGTAAIALDANDRATAAVLDQQGRPRLARQSAESSSGWTAWTPVATAPASDGLALAHNAQGRIELYLRDRHSRHALRIVQLPAPDALRNAPLQWLPAQDLALPVAAAPVAAADASGNLAVALQAETDGALWLYQHGRLVRMADRIASPPSLAVDAGSLYLAARRADDAQRYLLLRQSNGQWQEIASPPPPDGIASAFTP